MDGQSRCEPLLEKGRYRIYLALPFFPFGNWPRTIHRKLFVADFFYKLKSCKL